MAARAVNGQVARLEEILRADAGLMALLEALRALDLPQWRIVAGAVYQTVWNALTGRPRGTGIRDVDIFYFDDADIGWDAEDAVIRRAASAIPAPPYPLEVRNQARVHLWFADRFGVPHLPIASVDASLEGFAAIAHAVGVRLEADGRLDIAAPFGLDDMFAMVLRHNPANRTPASFMEKARRMQGVWPEITIIDA